MWEMPLKKGTLKKSPSWTCYNIASALCFGFLATVMWDLNSPSRDRTHTPCIARQNLFFFFNLFFYYFILFFNFTILYWFCHTSKWICHRYTCVPHPEPSSLLPPCTILLGRPSAPAPSIQYSASNLDWQFISYMILYMLQCHSPKSSHPRPLPPSPKDCSIKQCLFCCLVYRVIVTIFLNSMYMC